VKDELMESDHLFPQFEIERELKVAEDVVIANAANSVWDVLCPNSPIFDFGTRGGKGCEQTKERLTHPCLPFACPFACLFTFACLCLPLLSSLAISHQPSTVRLVGFLSKSQSWTLAQKDKNWFTHLGGETG